jgi:hypothetical protein
MTINISVDAEIKGVKRIVDFLENDNQNNPFLDVIEKHLTERLPIYLKNKKIALVNIHIY